MEKTEVPDTPKDGQTSLIWVALSNLTVGWCCVEFEQVFNLDFKYEK